jgi:hypothetical protein
MRVWGTLPAFCLNLRTSANILLILGAGAAPELWLGGLVSACLASSSGLLQSCLVSEVEIVTHHAQP